MSNCANYPEDPLEISDALLEAIARRAHFLADLTAEVLSTAGGRSAGGLSHAMLLEFAAILQLKLWENNGILQRIDPTAPGCASMVADFRQRVDQKPESFNLADSNSLSSRVVRLAADRLAWDPLDSFRADTCVEAMEDAELKLLAQFIWDNRHCPITKSTDGNDP